MPAINLLNFYFSVLCLSLDLSLDNCAVWVECAEGRQETLDPLSIYLSYFGYSQMCVILHYMILYSEDSS